jgi:chromosome segregation ATPase
MTEIPVEADDVNFDMNVIDKLVARGGDKLKPFKDDLADMNRIVGLISANLFEKEKEVDYLNVELLDLREKSAFLRRNLDETRTAQESMKDSIEIMSNMKGSMANREASNREEISLFEDKFEELKAVLSTGSGWTTGQTDQRISLEKERDCVTSKLENKNSELNSLRTNIDHIYDEIRMLEKEIFEEDKKAHEISEKVKDSHKTSHSLKKRKEEAELKLGQMRGTLMKANEELKSRQMKLTTEKRSLQELDNLIHGLKGSDILLTFLGLFFFALIPFYLHV